MEPITRTEKLMAGQQLEPITRKEFFLAKAAGMDVVTPEPITREEMFLSQISGGSGGGGTGGGGSSASVPWNDVTFIDYDGTVLHSYTLEEAQALTELPPLPERKGLICQGWNWSLEDIKAQGKVIVGATYITDDGKTRIYITLQEGRTSPILGVGVNGTVTVDWGDGTEPDVLTGTSPSTVVWTPNHEYAKAGDHVITLSVDGKMSLKGDAPYACVLRHQISGGSINGVYTNSVSRIEIGSDTYIYSNGCQALNSLSSITIPNSITSINTSSFKSCDIIKSISIPNSIKSIGDNDFNECTALSSISIPNSVTSIGKSAFYECTALSSISIPNSVTSIGNSAFYGCTVLSSISIPNSVTSIGNSAFANCYCVRYYDFSACTSVPTLTNTAFAGISADCQMLIPSALFDEWSTATNWATYASYMVAV